MSSSPYHEFNTKNTTSSRAFRTSKAEAQEKPGWVFILTKPHSLFTLFILQNCDLDHIELSYPKTCRPKTHLQPKSKTSFHSKEFYHIISDLDITKTSPVILSSVKNNLSMILQNKTYAVLGLFMFTQNIKKYIPGVACAAPV